MNYQKSLYKSILFLILCLCLLKLVMADSTKKWHNNLNEKPHQVHYLYDEFKKRLRPLNDAIRSETPLKAMDKRSSYTKTSLYDIFKKRLSCITDPSDHQYLDVSNDEPQSDIIMEDGSKRCDHCYGKYLNNKLSLSNDRIYGNFTGEID
ncbi:uncharacterized protein [Musca autumnalis]|uniref:uncharacterized protein n=1 Tax=Musca autumnalis TaxID=221902 RepID=UPI003CF88F26